MAHSSRQVGFRRLLFTAVLKIIADFSIFCTLLRLCRFYENPGETCPGQKFAFRDLYFRIPNEIRLETHFLTNEPFYGSKSSSSNPEIVMPRQEKVDRAPPFNRSFISMFSRHGYTEALHRSVWHKLENVPGYVEGYLRQFLPRIGYQYQRNRRGYRNSSSRVLGVAAQ